MTDQTTSLGLIRQYIADFCAERQWTAGENGKDLAMALIVEAAELAEIFQWLHSDETDQKIRQPDTFTHLEEELADVFWYLCRLANHYNIDMTGAVLAKASKNALRYPVVDPEKTPDPC